MSAILGVLFATLLGMVMIPTFMHFEHEGIENARIAATADQFKKVSDAAQAYIEANHTLIEQKATSSVPATISVAALAGTGFLPTSTAANNPYGQTWTIQVLQPSPGKLQALVLSTGGESIDQAKLPLVAAHAGAEGGFIPYPNQFGSLGPNVAQGSYGGWQVPMTGYTNPGQGHLAGLLYFNNGNLANNYLYRNAVPGHPELNAMQTDLSMTDSGNTKHNIIGANVISTQSLKALSDGSLATPSVVMSNGTVISWNQVGQGGVLGLKGANGQSVFLESLNGKFRLINSAWNKELFTVDQSGNVVAAGSLNTNGRIGSNGFNSDTGYPTGWGGGVHTWDVYAEGSVGVGQNGNLAFQADHSGNVRLSDTITVGSRIIVGSAFGAANPGKSCSPNGTIASNADGSGQILSCQNGVWYPVGGHWLRIGYYIVADGTSVWAPSCPSGGTPSIVVTPQSFKVNPTAAVSYGAIGNGYPWKVYIHDGSGAGLGGGRAIASTYCSY